MQLSVCLLTCQRLAVFQKCYESTLTALPEGSEVLVIVNGSDPETVRWLEARPDPRVRIFEVAREPRTRSRNRAFTLARGEVLYFLDDDVEVPSHLFHEALSLLERYPEIAVLGGPNLTPPRSTPAEQVFGGVMTSFFAAPMVRVRYGGKETRALCRADSRHLILCNLAVRLKEIPSDLRFREVLASNEENLFLHQCKARGLKMAYARDLFVYHYRRKTLQAFLAQIFSYGKGRGQQTRIAPFSCHLLFLAPSIFFGFLGILGWILPHGLAGIFGVYCTFCFLGSLASKSVRCLGVKVLFRVSILTPLLHLVYGGGFYVGFLFFSDPLSFASLQDGLYNE